MRNPADTICEYFKEKHPNEYFTIDDMNMGIHDFDIFYEFQIQKWVKFNEYWMSTDREMPVFIVKYEDLISNPKRVLPEVICFILSISKKSIKGALIESMIKNALQVVKPPKKIRNRLEDDQLDHIFNMSKGL